MILFDLICSDGHGFEAWFRDGGSFERLAAVGEVRCAICGGTDVRKALMAPNISTSRIAAGRADDEKAEAAAPKDDEKTASPASAAPGSVAVQENDRGPLTGNAGVPVPEKVAEAMRVMREVQTHIEKNFDHVGKHFAEEARKMHYGETEKRSIYGEATKEEAVELADEGIEVDQMPWLSTRNS